MTNQEADVSISPSSVAKRSEQQTSADMPGEAVILNPVTGTYFGLDEVGARVWELIETPRTVAELCAAIGDEYEVEAKQCEHDLHRLLHELCEAGLVEIEDGPAR